MEPGGPQGGREFQRTGTATKTALQRVPASLTSLADSTTSRASPADINPQASGLMIAKATVFLIYKAFFFTELRPFLEKFSKELN